LCHRRLQKNELFHAVSKKALNGEKKWGIFINFAIEKLEDGIKICCKDTSKKITDKELNV
jgi:hypothetical protein